MKTISCRKSLTLLGLLFFLGTTAPAAVLYSGGTWDFESGFQTVQIFDRSGHVGNAWNWWSERLQYQGQYFGFGMHNENKNPVNISRGIRSQETTMTCATGWAGLYRTAQVPANHRIRVEYDARTTWSEVLADVYTGINYHGVDTSFTSPTTQWTHWGKETGSWQRVSLTTTSTSTNLTVYIALRHEFPSCTGATFLFDNVEIFDDGPAGPTHTPTVTPTNTATFTPSFTPTNTPTAFPDFDGDGIPDSLEGLPPTSGQSHRWLPDSDGDGLSDGVEDANRNGQWDAGETRTRNSDSDGDGYEDGIEAILGSDPNNPASPATAFVDADGDRLPAQLDFMEDNPDSDGDRYADGYEAQMLGLGAVYNAAQHPGLGDANGDGSVTNLDALVTQALFLNLADPAQFAPRLADPNRDGDITNLDALVIQGYFLNAVPRLPLGL